VIIAGISLAYYLAEKQQRVQILRDQEKFHVALQSETFRDEFQSVISDLLVLSAHQQLLLIGDNANAADKAALTAELLSFCQHKKMYDQVRYLDATGMEVIRINNNQGHPVIVPADQLQSKGGRYYFKDTFRLGPGEVFVSPLDLNVEGGAIERPFKPMIRFGTPVFNSRGKKQGIILLNYFGKRLISRIEKVNRNSLAAGFGMLLNSDGYFLKGMHNEDEWGFMLPERQEKRFSILFPAQWGRITSAPSGQFMDEKGLFTFTTVYPLTEGLKSSSGSPETLGSSKQILNTNQYQWKIVSFTPHASIVNITGTLRTVLLSANILFGLVGGIVIWLLAKAIVTRHRAEDEIQRMAHFDLLTGLPNRALLNDRLEMSLASARRETRMLAVLFIDLDGFKAINDQLGHKAGDAALKEVARRLQACIRKTDTAARQGGDEFVLVLTSIKTAQDAGLVAEKFMLSLAEPIMLDNQPRTMGASIGIALYPQDGDTPDTLVSKADTAMYVAKEKGKNNYRFCA